MGSIANNNIEQKRQKNQNKIADISNNLTNLDKPALIERIRLAEERIQELTNRIIFIKEDEARRISRELHDETSHSLILLKLYLEIIYKELPRSLTSVRKKTKDALGLLKNMFKEVRSMMLNLRPAKLDDVGLVAALRFYIKSIYPTFKAKIFLKISRNFPRLPRNIEVVIYRVVQEALSNAIRHSQASKIKIDLQYKQKIVNLSVKDDGIGFNLKQVLEKKRDRSFGLFGIQERALLLGGTANIESQLSKGTEISIQLPLPQNCSPLKISKLNELH